MLGKFSLGVETCYSTQIGVHLWVTSLKIQLKEGSYPMAILAKIKCEVSNGLRESEAVASFRDYKTKRHYIRVERDFLIKDGLDHYLPVTVIGSGKGYTLIQLPQEAETGANRVWIGDSLVKTKEAVA